MFAEEEEEEQRVQKSCVTYAPLVVADKAQYVFELLIDFRSV